MTERDTERRRLCEDEAEIRVMLPQAKESWKMPSENSFLAPADTSILTSNCQNQEKINSLLLPICKVCFKQSLASYASYEHIHL